jgi:hypothetical protein
VRNVAAELGVVMATLQRTMRHAAVSPRRRGPASQHDCHK